MKKPILTILLVSLLAAFYHIPSAGTSVENGTADTILTNGKIYTANPDQPWAEAVAIKGGKFDFIGSSSEVKKFLGRQTEVIDLGGKMAMPGLYDSHVHPIYGGLKQFECVFPFSATPDEIAQAVSKHIEENPDAKWIVGGQWQSTFFDEYDIDSPRKWLDKICSDKPVMLKDDTGHNCWVNSKTLELAKIDKNSPEVKGGEIVRDPATGEPNGLLYESAMYAVMALMPDYTADQYLQAAQEAMKIANRYGIVGLKEASTSLQGLKAYKAVDDAGKISVHLSIQLPIFFALNKDLTLNPKTFARMKDKYGGKHIHTDFAKIFMDGVPTGSRTAAMLEDYLPAHEGAETHSGKLHYSPEVLAKLMTQLDKLGYTIKVHTAGDRAVRVTLDAIEHARKANGNSGLRHELAHAGFIDDKDLSRFAALNAVADVSPYIWFPSPIMDSVVGAIGERGQRYWPIKTLLDSGAQVIAGSDWPAAVPDMNPWGGLEAMVSRKHPEGEYPGVYWGEEAITLEQTLHIFTLSGAKASKIDKIAGSIETGKFADMIVLNQNLFEIPVERISETKVEMTWFEGKLVYKRELQ
jgi:predicted amidohydrolase YtcJ